MRWFLPGLLLSAQLFMGPASAQQAVFVPATTNSIPIAGTTGAATVLIPGVVGQRIYVTAVVIAPASAPVVTFTSGTGVGCGTGTANVTGAMNFANNQDMFVGSGHGAIWVLPTGASLCITITTGTAPGSLAYAQF